MSLRILDVEILFSERDGSLKSCLRIVSKSHKLDLFDFPAPENACAVTRGSSWRAKACILFAFHEHESP